MAFDSKILLNYWAQKPLSRRSILFSLATAAIAQTSIGRAFGVTSPALNIILGRPTANSIAFNIISSEKVTAYIEYGYTKSRFVSKSASTTIDIESPTVIELKELRASSKIYYRVRYALGNSKTYEVGRQGSFATAKKVGSSFSFTVHGDTHPERAGKMFNSELYYVTMANVAEQQPDFHILMGDDFSIDPLISKGQANQANVEKIYRTHRDWLGVIGHSVPIFLVNGNHEQAASYLLDGTQSNPAVLAGNARLKYYPLPAPDNFYTGNSVEIAGVGLPRDYYSWTWGDALFVTLDPYWHSKNPVDNPAGDLVADDQATSKKAPAGSNKKNQGATPSPTSTALATPTLGNGKTKDLWSIGIGDEQYAWLKKTLETSKAKFKFVFAHHVMGTGRGAVEVSQDYEWGGRDPKGVTTFAKERPNWELPIHDLMVKNKVSIFFQGHDHIFVTQERDGLIYQAMPNPADDTFSMFNSDAYKTGTKAPNSGHVRVSVSSAQAKVEYFLAARSKDSSRKNLSIAHSYIVKPKA